MVVIDKIMSWVERALSTGRAGKIPQGNKLYQRRLYLRDAIYEVLDTHLLDSSIEYYQYCWILLETSRSCKICSSASGLAAADVDLQHCLAT
eukprot:SAG11_NODE_185_length_13160_cov_9.118521_7_plen_92_part_00